jgi:general secretion pathway protein F
MAIFEYKGFNGISKKNVKGVIDADSPRLLRTQLKKQGIYLTEYAETSSRGGKAVRRGNVMETAGSKEVDFKRFFQRVKLMEVAVTTRQMATLIRAGISVVDALNACVDQTENDKFKTVLTSVKQAVNEGAALADALSVHPKIFSVLYINMVRAGESSGNLDIVFERLSDFIEGQVKLRSKLVGTLTYPAIMVGIAMMIIGLMMTFVVPKMTEMFAEMGGELPLITRVLIGASEFFQGYWWLMILSICGFVYWFRKWKTTEKGRHWVDDYSLRVPVFGSLIRMVAVARFSRTFGTLLSSGVPVLTALNIVKNVVNNVVLADVIDSARVAIQEGEGIAKPLERSQQFPPMMTHMIAIGEKTGQLEQMLDNVSDAYETQVDSKVMQLTSVLEPVIIVVMGIGVGFMVFAILLPMLQMNEMIAGSR